MDKHKLLFSNKDLKKELIFAVVFSIIGFIFLQIPVNKLAGSDVSFTLFDLFAPLTAAFLGPVVGIISVFAMTLGNLVYSSGEFTTASIIRLFPILFAVYYFARKDRSNVVIPALAMVAFWLHPVGREVWYYALFWLIPIAAYFRKDILFLRALGSTFTAHAVGGALWIWFVGLPASIWVSLIPVVAMERLFFAAGISASYVALTNIVAYLENKGFLTGKIIGIEKKYIFSKIIPS